MDDGCTVLERDSHVQVLLESMILNCGQITRRVTADSRQEIVLSFHGWWSEERTADILADLAAIRTCVGSCDMMLSLELKDVEVSNHDLGHAILSSLVNCRHLTLNECLGSHLDILVASCLEHLPQLQTFTYCGSSWNLSSFPTYGAASNLKGIHLENCRFKSSNEVESLALGLKRCAVMKMVQLTHCCLKDEDLKVIVKHLPVSIQTLDLTGNYCRSEGAAALAGVLLDNAYQQLETINLTNQHPGECGGSLDLSLLGLAIVSNTSLRHLDLSFNMLSCLDIQSLVASLAKNRTLCSIHLMGNVLDDRAMHFIGKYLPRIQALACLNILANRFGETGADALLHGLTTNVVLCDLPMPRGFMASERIDYYLALNRGGRRLLHNGGSLTAPCPLSLWKLVLGRVNGLYENDPSMRATVLFHLLQGPVLLGKRT